MDLSTNSFDVEQLIIVNKVKMELVHLIAACICDCFVVNCQSLRCFYFKTVTVKRHCLQRPGIAEVQEIEFRPPRLTDAE